MHTELTQPLLEEYRVLRGNKAPVEAKRFALVKGMLGEVVVLQCLNRLQNKLDYAEWAVAPASAREDRKTCQLSGDKTSATESPAFDLKMTFCDQTFIPVEVKWSPATAIHENDVYRENSVPVVYANTRNWRCMLVAEAMQREIDGQSIDMMQVNYLTKHVLTSMEDAKRHGQSIYGDTGLEAVAAELSLSALLINFRKTLSR